MNKFWKSALMRAIRTIAQTAIASIGTSAVLEAVDWRFVVSASLLAGLLSVLTSIATGLPEAEEDVAFDDEIEDVVREDIEVKG